INLEINTLAKEAKQDAAIISLAAILAKLSADPANQTTLAAILAKLITAPATEARQITTNAALGTPTDVPVDAVTDATARSGVSLWESSVNCLRHIKSTLVGLEQ